MGFFELLLIGIGLSMDAFAVALCQGLCMSKFQWKQAGIISLFFGGFQALMPLVGWALGSQFAGSIQQIDHWVAFVLLGIIGGNMVREGLSSGEEEISCAVGVTLNLSKLLLMAVATSIDALAIGVTFAFLNVNIWEAISTIGITTFCLSMVGVAVGNFFGVRYKQRAELAGGIILIALGCKILLEHLGLF